MNAKIVEAKAGQYLVHYDGLDSAFDELVPAARLRVAAVEFRAGDTVEIQKGVKWIKGKVLDVKPGQCLVHYDGLDAAFDEWVPVTRVRAGGAEAVTPAAGAGDFAVGSAVDAKWGARWWAATIIGKRPGQYQVRYDFDKSEEWVAVDRVKARGAAEPAGAGPRPGPRSAVGPNATVGQDADVKLTEPVWAGAAMVSMGPAGMPWTYVPAKAALVPQAPATAANIRLTGGTGQFFEKCTIGGFAVGKTPAVLVCFKDAPPGKPVTAQVQLIDLPSGRILADWNPLPETEALAVSPDGKRILCRSDKFHIGTKGRLDLWAIEAGKARQVMSWRPSTETEWAKVDVKTAQFIDDAHVLTLCADQKLVLWELPAAKAVWQMHADILANPVFTDDRRVLLVAAENRIGLIETLTGKCLGVLPPEIPAASRFAFSPDGKRLAVAGNSAIALWDLEKPAPLIEVGQSVPLGDILWVADDMLLADNKYLIDPKLGVVIWRITPGKGGGEIKLAGSRAWRIDTEQGGARQKKQYTLIGAGLPLEAARKAAARIKPETAYLLLPGAKVSLDFNQPAINADIRNRAIQAVKAQLQEAGVGVADGQVVQIVAAKNTGESKTAEYRMFGGGTQSVNYTIQQYAVKVMAADMLAWQAVGTSGAPPLIVLRQGETAQDHVNKHMEQSDQYFTRVKIPRLIAQPSRAPGFGESPL